jgi:CRP/FNR family transcriptional regulator, cyclic AMP receptor protein
MNEQDDLVSALQSIPWFQELDPVHFDLISGISHLCQVEPGDILFREGDKEGYLYIVLEGRIAIEISVPARGRVVISTAEPMDVLGWSSVTPVVRQRTAGARAVFPSRLVCLESASLRRLCDENHDLGYIVMRRLANVIAARLLTTRLQLLDMFTNPGE